jgi:hypothetical protein
VSWPGVVRRRLPPSSRGGRERRGREPGLTGYCSFFVGCGFDHRHTSACGSILRSGQQGMQWAGPSEVTGGGGVVMGSPLVTGRMHVLKHA